MILFLIICSLLIVITLLLLARVTLVIDTFSERYYAKIGRVLVIEIVFGDERYFAAIKVFFMKNKIFKKQLIEKNNTDFKAEKLLRIAFSIFKSLKIKKLNIDFDTGSFMKNAYLYPLTHIIRNRKIQISMNYRGNNNFLLMMENRLIWILSATIK